MGLYVKTTGEVIDLKPEGDDGGYTLKQLQKAVGGYIELVNLGYITLPGGWPTLMFMCVNEEGKTHGLPPNPKATELAQLQDVIVGDVLIGTADEMGYGKP